MFALLQAVAPRVHLLATASLLVSAEPSSAAIARATSHPVTHAVRSATSNSGVRSQIVKIRLATSQQAITLSGLSLQIRGEQDGIRLGNSNSSSHLHSSSLQPGVFAQYIVKAKRVAGRVLWTLQSKDSGRVLYRLLGEQLQVRGEFVRVDVKPTPGELTLIADRSGHQPTFDVIGRLELESYLEGVLPNEMPAKWPLDAIKAQAIVSRSYALARVVARERAGAFFHLEASTMDQVFSWDSSSSQVERGWKERIRQAINETRGMVLHDEAGRVLTAYFHADCGGRTEAAASVWGGETRGAGTVDDGSCPLSPAARWSWSTTSEEIASKLRIPLGLIPGSHLNEVRLLDFSSSGRVQSLELVFGDGQVRKLTGHQLRTLLGFEHLKSTLFSVQKSVSGFRFSGRGHGHGVGLCQWGSRQLARNGLDFQSILTHYYPTASLRRQDIVVASEGIRSTDLYPPATPDLWPEKTL